MIILNNKSEIKIKKFLILLSVLAISTWSVTTLIVTFTSVSKVLLRRSRKKVDGIIWGKK
ncbi:hypothetical protein [Spiroplasma endosymbiont of Polydrusus formosus]|uniref:hypothetical protein n=1 Tax=Spiroplasma endosymbiont of Polydrusus formosus TaxID=3139326 RepID=UPI0035B54B47